MPWSNGNYTRTNGTFSGPLVWQDDADAGFGIEDPRHDTHDEDLADGIDQCLNKNGENAMNADLPMGGNKVTGLGAGVAATDAISKGQADAAYIATDGSATVTADIPFNDNKLTGLADGTDPQDAATVAQLGVALEDYGRISGSTVVYNGNGIASSTLEATGEILVTFDNAAASTDEQSAVTVCEGGGASFQFNSALGYVSPTTIRVFTGNVSGTATAVTLPFSIHRKYTPA